MRTEPDALRDPPDLPALTNALDDAVVVVTPPLQEVANDDAAADETPGYRPNPLWAVNAALAAFLFVAALLLARG